MVIIPASFAAEDNIVSIDDNVMIGDSIDDDLITYYSDNDLNAGEGEDIPEEDPKMDIYFDSNALDDNGKTVRVPRLILQTEDEHLAWSHGEERQRIRVERKKNKLDGF